MSSPRTRPSRFRALEIPRRRLALAILFATFFVGTTTVPGQAPAPAGGITGGASSVPSGQTGAGQISLPPVQSSMQTAPGVNGSNAAADAVLYPGEDFRL